MWLLYQLAVAVTLVVAGPVLLVLRGAHYLPTVAGRLGRYRDPAPGAEPLWIHAVSVGEAAVATTLARALPEEVPLVVTTVTPTGQHQARRALGARAAFAYLPYELGFAVRRFFARFRPRALILVEGDLWPLVLRSARRRGLPIVVINGRISDRSFPRLARLRPFLGPILDPVTRFAVQSAADRERLLALGVAPGRIEVTGNLKFDSPEPTPRPELEAAIEALAGGRPIVVAGSTMPGEEEQVAAAFGQLGGGHRALLVLAPRHPERAGEALATLQRAGHGTVRRSALPQEGRPDVVLLDTVGELAALYRLADAAFIGGTLAPTGGHNPLEPARFGVPTAVGRSMENFRAIAAAFDREGAWRRIDDAAGLAAAWGEWLDRPDAAAELGERGRRLVEANRGALDRTLELLRATVPGATSG